MAKRKGHSLFAFKLYLQPSVYPPELLLSVNKKSLDYMAIANTT